MSEESPKKIVFHLSCVFRFLRLNEKSSIFPFSALLIRPTCFGCLKSFKTVLEFRLTNISSNGHPLEIVPLHMVLSLIKLKNFNWYENITCLSGSIKKNEKIALKIILKVCLLKTCFRFHAILKIMIKIEHQFALYS